jgi:hypothetical protein
VRHFLNSIELSDLVKGIDTGRESSVKTEDLAFNHSSQREVIEKLSKMLPHICVSILPQALIIEAIAVKENET